MMGGHGIGGFVPYRLKTLEKCGGYGKINLRVCGQFVPDSGGTEVHGNGQ
jgi:hypothetical protein